MTTTINFPTQLPTPLRDGYEINHVSPLMRIDMVSGRARQRRKYTNVPSIVPVSWLLRSSAHAQVFEAWFRDAINDGADWFNCRLKTPIGLKSYECRFTDMYKGPKLIGRDAWQFTAELEIKERPLAPVGWGLFPDFIEDQAVIDVSVNEDLP